MKTVNKFVPIQRPGDIRSVMLLLMSMRNDVL